MCSLCARRRTRFFCARRRCLSLASRHTAHPIQAPGQRLAPHPSCWQALVPTCLFGAHGHDSAHQHTLLSPPWTLQRDEGPPSTPLFAAVTPLLALGFLLLSL